MYRIALLATLAAVALGMAPSPETATDDPSDPNGECCGTLPGLLQQTEDMIWSEVPPQGNEIQVLPFSLVAGAQGLATGGFGCAARAAADAESVRIVSCTSGPDFANTVVFPGSVAATAGIHSETTSTSMIREVCYEVKVRYIDGRTPQWAHGCSQQLVLLE